jgi:hypothetical protein
MPGAIMRNRTIFAIAAMLCVSSEAMAQRYYSRVKIGGAGSAPSSATPATPPTPVCGALASGKFIGGTVTLGSAGSLNDAQTMCNAARSARGPGSCSYVGSNVYSDFRKVYWGSSIETITFVGSGSSQIYAASCS